MDKQELSDVLEKVAGDNDSIKDALDTLHPKEEKRNPHIKKNDKLAILNDTQIDCVAVLEWQDKAMAMTPKQFESENVTTGFTDKVKGLTVSKDGIGRTEIPGVMQPKIIGEMLQQGIMPMQGQPQGPQKPGFFKRLFGSR